MKTKKKKKKMEGERLSRIGQYYSNAFSNSSNIQTDTLHPQTTLKDVFNFFLLEWRIIFVIHLI